MIKRVAILFACLAVLLVGSTTAAQADTATQLPFANNGGAWLAVDPSGGHVFVSGGPGTSSIVVLNYSGKIVKTITGEGGASQMAVDTATHTLYVALHDATAISEIDTQTLTESGRFSTAPYPDPSSLAIAGGKLWFTCFQNDGEGCHNVIRADLDGGNMAPAPSPFASYSTATDLTAGGPGNKYLAVGDSYVEPPDVDVYDVSGATPTLVSHVWNPEGGSSDVQDMTFDPSGANLLLACGAPYHVESLSTSTLLSSADYPTGPYPISVAVTADGNFVAGGINTNSGPDVFVFPVGQTTPVRTWQVGEDTLSGINHGLAFSPDASKLFAVTKNSASGHLVFHVLTRPTAHLTATSIALHRSAATVRYGKRVKLTVRVNGAKTGKVDLVATPIDNVQRRVASGTLKSGRVTFNIKPKQTARYSAQLEQGSTYAASTSTSSNITVSLALSVTTRPDGFVNINGRRESRTFLIAHARPRLDTSEEIEFVVQRRIGGHWSTSATVSLPISHGTVKGFLYSPFAGQHRLQAVWSGNTAYGASKSAWHVFSTPSAG